MHKLRVLFPNHFLSPLFFLLCSYKKIKSNFLGTSTLSIYLSQQGYSDSLDALYFDIFIDGRQTSTLSILNRKEERRKKTRKKENKRGIKKKKKKKK
jgi:hypothetical protein